MNISSNDVLAGYPALATRNFLRSVGEFTPGTVMHVFNVGLTPAKKYCEVLEADGYIEKHPTFPTFYRKTASGSRLSNATAARRIKRATADRIVGTLMNAIRNSFRDIHQPFLLNRVWLFGSYIREAPTLSDIDVTIEAVPKETGNAHIDACLKYYRKHTGKAPSDHEEAEFVKAEKFAYCQLIRRIKVSRYVSIHEWAETQQLGIDVKQVF
jgi:hypothetical protein